MGQQEEFVMSDEDKKDTFIVIPAYNEEDRVQPVVEDIAKKGFRMVVVNDGSTDKTLEQLK